jgi:hypothetical protein
MEKDQRPPKKDILPGVKPLRLRSAGEVKAQGAEIDKKAQEVVGDLSRRAGLPLIASSVDDLLFMLSDGSDEAVKPDKGNLTDEEVGDILAEAAQKEQEVQKIVDPSSN